MSEKGFQSLLQRAHDSHVVVRRGVAQAIAFMLSSREASEPSHMEKEAMAALAEQLTDVSDLVRLQAAEAQSCVFEAVLGVEEQLKSN